jgi:hypothetical protein
MAGRNGVAQRFVLTGIAGRWLYRIGVRLGVLYRRVGRLGGLRLLNGDWFF